MGSCWSKLKKKSKPSNREHARSISRSLKKSVTVQYDPKILILGAGVAGLACAVELKSRGFNNVRIVEMSDRIGGRIKTIKFADNYVDLGAQWVYGQRGNVVYKMVKSFNELGRSDNMLKQMDWIRSNGDKVPRSVVEQMLNLITNIYTEMQGEHIDPQATFGEYLSKMFEREVERRNINLDWRLANEFIHTFKKMEGNMSDSDISAYNYWSYKPCEGGGLLNWRDKGFKQYLRHLVKGDELNEHGVLKDCIDLNQKAIEIEWDRLDGAVHVKCENKKYIVDHAVITVSLGVLKHNTTLFQPRLPDSHCKAINCMGFGSVCKIFIEFEEKFWPDDWHGFNALWRKGDTPTDHWLKDIYCFHVYDYQPRVLLGWACGLEVEVIETIEHIALVEGIVHMLQRFLPNFRLPHLTNVKISKWGIDPAHYGSYSYPSVIASENDTGPAELAQPVNKIVYESRRSSNMSDTPRSTLTAATMAARPVLFFAGEATSSDHYSTVHGAVETGIREADRIISFYDRPSTYAAYYNSLKD